MVLFEYEMDRDIIMGSLRIRQLARCSMVLRCNMMDAAWLDATW